MKNNIKDMKNSSYPLGVLCLFGCEWVSIFDPYFPFESHLLLFSFLDLMSRTSITFFSRRENKNWPEIVGEAAYAKLEFCPRISDLRPGKKIYKIQ